VFLAHRLRSNGLITLSTESGEAQVSFHYSSKDAAEIVKSLADSLDFVELNAQDAVSAINGASSQGVRGARIHDLMHAVAAQKYQATVIFTLDEAGFSTLKTSIPTKAP
jgi:predicted nucleic acid-binding protein